MHRNLRSLVLACALLLASASAHAQLPRVGSIDFYGLRLLKPADLIAALSLEIGDSLRIAPAVLRERLLRVPGVVDASVSTICCEAGRTMVYVGIRELGAASPGFVERPTGAERLPPEIVDAGQAFYDALRESVMTGAAEEDYSAGHALAKYAPARAIQQRFIAYASAYPEILRTVLQRASESSQRALAAQILAYAADKRAVVPDLVAAMRDPDEDVRNNAMRALAVMAMYEQQQPAAALDVPFAPFIDLLNSVHWTDRNKASFALAALTTARDTVLLHELRDRAFDSLVEIARWRAFGHAAPAGLILGRIAGLPEAEIMPVFQNDREAIIAAARAAAAAPAARQ